MEGETLHCLSLLCQAALLVRLVDQGGKHVTGVHFDPRVSLPPQPRLSLSSPVVGRDAHSSEGRELCGDVRAETELNSRGVAMGVRVLLEIRGRAGRGLLSLTDSTDTAPPLLLPFSLTSGQTLPERSALEWSHPISAP